MSHLDAVNVVVLKGHVLTSIVSFPTTKSGIREAEKYFKDTLNQIKVAGDIRAKIVPQPFTAERLEEALEDGFFEYGTNEVTISWSISKEEGLRLL